MLYEIGTDKFNKKVIAQIKKLWGESDDTMVTVTGPAKKKFLLWLTDEYGNDVMCTMAGLYDKIYYRPAKRDK